MFLAIILQTMILFLTAQSIPIDNGVEGEPEIECGSTAITVNFNTRNNFEGHVYVKPHFLTKVDGAYRVSCFYMETSKDVSSRLDVSELTTTSVTGAVLMPVCRYDILDGSVHGNPVPFGKIGQQVYHRWSCTSQNINTFCMLVHSCSVDDGKGDRVNILDADGCAIDRYVLNNIEYPDDLLAGQEAHVYKYADRNSLFYQCQISIQVKEKGECRRPVCPDLLNSSPSKVFTKFQQGTGSVHGGGPRTFTTSRPLLEPVYGQGYQDHYKRQSVKVFAPGLTLKVDGGASKDIESRLLRERRSGRSIDSPLTVDVRAQMTALDIDEGNYTISTSSAKHVCLTHQMLAVSMSFVLVIICSLLSLTAVFAMRLSQGY